MAVPQALIGGGVALAHHPTKQIQVAQVAAADVPVAVVAVEQLTRKF